MITADDMNTRKPARTRRRRINRDQLHALMSAAERQRLSLDPAHPRRKPSLPVLKFLMKAEAS